MDMVASDPQPPSQPRGRSRWIQRGLWLIVVIVILRIGGCMMFMITNPAGLEQGRLRACPNSPNCVCSQDTAAEHAIAPLSFTGDVAAAKARLIQAIATLPRSKIVVNEPSYLHVTCTTLVLRFVDDLEFLIDAEAQAIHVRSASRLGYSDLGVNRKRVETLREAWNALP